MSVGKVEGNYEAGQLIPVGKPFPTVKIRFMTDDGQAAAPGEAGEMYVSSPMVSQAYYRDEERSRAVYVADPLGQEPGVWFRSGDYGFLDAQGRLNVLGRKDSIMATAWSWEKSKRRCGASPAVWKHAVCLTRNRMYCGHLLRAT